MSHRKFPLLKQADLIAILTNLGFTKDRQDGTHAQYECLKTDKYPRSIVTVDVGYPEFEEKIIKSMIRQSNRSREEFYGATKRIANKDGPLAGAMESSKRRPYRNFEPPLAPELECQTDRETLLESTAKVVAAVERWLVNQSGAL